MSVSVAIPRRLYELALKRGIDVESRVVELLLREANLDPGERASVRLELAERCLKEAEEALARGDTVQSSEKLYKAAEECVKAMAEALRLEEAEEAWRRGRWTLSILDSAARKLADRVSGRVYDDWDHAYFLHVEGFHEARLDRGQVEARLRYVAELVEIARKVLAGEVPPSRS